MSLADCSRSDRRTIFSQNTIGKSGLKESTEGLRRVGDCDVRAVESRPSTRTGTGTGTGLLARDVSPVNVSPSLMVLRHAGQDTKGECCTTR